MLPLAAYVILELRAAAAAAAENCAMPRPLPRKLHAVHQAAGAPRQAAWLWDTIVTCQEQRSWWRA